MTLVLGAPGSGKTTFLKALAGKLDSSLKLQGKVFYNGKTIPSTPHYLCSYVSQYDLHHAEMTVREIIDFSSNLLGTNNEFEILRDALTRNMDTCHEVYLELFSKATKLGEGSNLKTNYIIKIFGLSDCADTIVGDALLRGISGGQKKRTTIGEMLVGRAKCFFMDDVSTGLDSSTTLDIMTLLRQMTHLLDLTMVISLLQPDPETFELFDDIILLCDGRIIYHGPRDNVVSFFNTIGFTCPKRKNVADFLQEVTSKMDQQQYWAGGELDYQYHSIEIFEKDFRAYNLPKLLEDKQCRRDDKQDSKASEAAYRKTISKWNIFKACFLREVLLVKSNSPVHIFKAIQIILIAFVLATLFFRTEMNYNTVLGGNKFMGSLFMAIAVINFNGMTELAMTIKRLATFYKQRELLGLPGWAILGSIFLVNIPMSVLETGLWTCSTYHSIGYAPSPIRFCQQLLVLFAMHQMSMSLYRLIASIGRTQVMTNILGTEALIAIFILGGFIISKDDLQPWLHWGHWASPFTYSLNAAALNEFADKRWATVFHFDKVNTTGEAILKARGFLIEWHWYWVCVVVLFGFSLIFNLLSIFSLELLNYPQEHHLKVKPRKVQAAEYKHISFGSWRDPTDRGNLPFQPLSLTFSQINYFVDMPRQMRKHGATEERFQLLRDVNGAFRPGVLTALMGITGAGKTTLLDVLAGRKTGGYIEGTIHIEGYPKRQETFSRISGYCEQMDIHSPCLTVYESLQFSAYLRLPSEVNSQKRDMFVEEVMGLIELTDLRNAMVGIPGVAGLSAEQRKRLTIAVELVANPSIIFLDEPTTGLDARAAAIVMRTVRKTVNTGRTVVCTIHQPSIEIFESFDELLLMKRGGQLIYSGSLGQLSRSLINYFEAIPGVPTIKEGQNPAAWALDISSHAMEYAIGVDYSEIYRNSSLHRENMALVAELSKPRAGKYLNFPPRYWPDFKAQCIACIWKQHCSYWKNPELNVTRFLSTFGVSITFGMVFWQVGSKIEDEQDVLNILGTAYTFALFLGYVNCATFQPTITMERVVYYREKASGMYSSMPYVIAQVGVEILYMFIQVFMFSAVVYPMVGFEPTATKFFWFVLYMILSFIDFTLYGMMAVALTPNEEIATVLSFFIFLIWNVFAGFIVPRKMMPTWWRWMYWADPAAWTMYGLMFSQLGDHMELIRVPGQPDQPVSEFLKEYLGLQGDYIALVTTLHIALSILLGVVFFLGIKYLKFQRR
ncbi:hypothetical protein HU200_064060 [Digitaria exilis]|uniref:ABC transporter domain-containing protein n=1 Tax=Digitaria exilis TaxID=1010633 RepID=A0A835A476_9POAL|nr:hypothetical protein HU200_064060 [Digitaria exilis]